MGHRLYCLCGHHPGVSVLLLHLQKMDIQEEKQKEGQRQGQKCHQHEGRDGWSQNRGKDYCCLKFRKHFPPYSFCWILVPDVTLEVENYMHRNIF